MTTDILFEKSNHIGIITLNRPQALNALNETMILALEKELTKWQHDDDVKAVVIRANGEKAFCAGGDIRKLYEAQHLPKQDVLQFFWHEYRLNRQIHHYTKPYVALIHGIDMGGGVGVSVHASHRVVSEKITFAMPETSIGFFPDVGGSYFLARCPGFLGTYLALTGARVHSADALFLELADSHVAHEKFNDVIEALKKANWNDDPHRVVSNVIHPFSSHVDSSHLKDLKTKIDQHFKFDSVEEIIQSLQQDVTDEWCHKTLETLKKVSPTSLKVTLKQIREGAKRDFDECMQMEYQMVYHFLHGHDFYEGIRAAIIDKDQSPKWQPANLSEVSETIVDSYFKSATKELTFD